MKNAAIAIIIAGLVYMLLYGVSGVEMHPYVFCMACAVAFLVLSLNNNHASETEG